MQGELLLDPTSEPAAVPGRGGEKALAPAQRTDVLLDGPRRVSPRRDRSSGGDVPVSEPERVSAVPAVEHTARERRRWGWCLVRAEQLGADRERFVSQFTSTDIADLVAEDITDEVMAACVETVVRSIDGAASGRRSADEFAASVRCSLCRHFASRADGARWGRCERGIPGSGATVLHFADHQHPCALFESVQAAFH